MSAKIQSLDSKQGYLKENFLSFLEYVCVSYMHKMGLLLYVKDPTTPASCSKKAQMASPPTPEAVARDMVYQKCCKRNCLATLSPTNDFNESVEMVAAYLDDWYLLDKSTHREKFLALLRAQTTGITYGGERQGQLFLNIGSVRYPVCRDAFARAHNRAKTYYDKMVQHLKNGNQPEKARVSSALVANLKTKGGLFGVKLSNDDFTAMNVGKTIAAIRTAIWMDAHFKLIGDHVPNSSSGEIHLEKQEKKSIFNEYKAIFDASGHSSVMYGRFTQLWSECFPHVKIRSYKQVSGKCYTCVLLSYLRSKFKDPRRRSLVNELHAHHKAMYSKERMSYYKRSTLAENSPELFWSDIIDGMSSSKTVCPSFKDSFDYKPTLNMHIQGVLAHGRTLDLYRSFPNLNKTCNLAIHSWLMTLEAEYKDKGKLPDTIYHQIDGGSENTGKTVLAVSEMLVAKRLTKKVVLTRLPVGHTHEDIDAVFGVIWSKVMNHNVLSPEQYKRLLLLSGREKEKTVKVVDVWSVPNYIEYFKHHINKNVGRYAKSEWSQLQIIFEATDACEDCPLGVKVSYRPYASQEVSLLKKLKKKKGTTGFKPTNSSSLVFETLENLEAKLVGDKEEDGGQCLFPGIIVDDEEEDDEEVEENEEGQFSSDHSDTNETTSSSIIDSIGYVPIRYMVNEHVADGRTFVLKELPTATEIKPQPFVPGFREAMDIVYRKVTRKLEGLGTCAALEDWNKFMSNEVPCQDEEDYHRMGKPLHIPFREALFGLSSEGRHSTTEALIAHQNQVDLAAGARDDASSFGRRQTYQSMPSMIFQKGTAAPFPFARGDTYQDAVSNMKNMRPPPKKKRRRRAMTSTSAGSPTTGVSKGWHYETARKPTKNSNSDRHLWNWIGKSCDEDDETWTIVNVVKNRGMLFYKYIQATKYDELKNSDEDHLFEFTKCDEFHCENSDFQFHPPTKGRLKRLHRDKGSSKKKKQAKSRPRAELSDSSSSSSVAEDSDDHNCNHRNLAISDRSQPPPGERKQKEKRQTYEIVDKAARPYALFDVGRVENLPSKRVRK